MNPYQMTSRKKVALLDVDGVLAEFIDPLLYYMNTDLKKEDITKWDFFSIMTPKQRSDASAILHSSIFWRTQPVIPGAIEGVQKIKDADYEVVYTTKPWVRFDKWGHIRRKWLEEHFGAHPDEVMIGHRKDLLMGDIFIDDNPEHATAFRNRQHHNVFLFDAPYNQNVDGFCNNYRIFSWDDIDRILGHG